MKRLFTVLISFSLIPLAGCGAVLQQALQKAVLNSKANLNSPPAQADTQYIASIKPNPKSGAGVVIFEPVVASNAKNSKALGTGIGRFLHFYVAGQGAFGKTTTLGHLDEVRRQYKLANWQVAAPTNAAALKTIGKYTKSLGATLYATGKIEQANGMLNVSYSLYPAGSNKARASWKVSAPTNQIAAKLPDLARKMAASAGAKSPSLPPKMALTSSDLAILGSPSFLEGRKADVLAPAVAANLLKLGQKDALAATLAISYRAFSNEKQGIALAKTAIKLAPNNAFAISEPGAAQFSETVPTLIIPQIEAFNRKFPSNALGQHAATISYLEEKDLPNVVDSAEQAVECATGNAYFWRFLSVAHSEDADGTRNGRYSKDVTRAEWDKIDVSYARALGASKQATKVDPNYSFGWSRVSNDATFMSDPTTAFATLEKALALDNENRFAWRWGAQITQPKWYGSKSEFVAYEKRAAQNAKYFEFNVRDMVSVLNSGSDRRDMRDILEIVLKNDPKNAEAASELGQYYHYDEANYPRAEALYKQSLAIAPNDGRTNSAYGDLIFWTKQDAKTAEKLYLKAIAADPNDGYYYGNLGRMLALTGRKAEGVKMAQKAKALGLGNYHPVWEATGVTPPNR